MLFFGNQDYVLNISAYKVIERSDMPGLHDYPCRLSVSMATCTWSVYDIREAEYMCSADEECRAFVVAPHKTWTGWSIKEKIYHQIKVLFKR